MQGSNFVQTSIIGFIKKDSGTDVFPVNLAQIFRTVFLQNTSGQHEFTIEKN